MEDLKNELKMLKRSDGKINTAIIRRSSFLQSELNENITRKTSFLSENATYSEKFFVIENDITSVPVCKICKTELCSFSKIRGTYSETCSIKECIVKNTIHNPTSGIESKKKNKKELLDKMLNDDKSLLSVEQIIRLVDDIGLDRIRISTNYDLVRSLYHSTKETLPGSSIELISQRYYHVVNGIRSVPLCAICRTKQTAYINSIDGYRKSCADKDCYLALGALNRVSNYTKDIREKLSNNGFEIVEFDYLNSGNIVKLKCDKGHEFSRYIHNGRWKALELCTICNDSQPFSTEEKNLLKDIRKYYNGNVEENHKLDGRKEIDIYIPEFKLGIEYNGMYWHSYDSSESTQEKNKHLHKMELAKQQGIKLIQFSSVDYVNNYAIVHSRIKNLLGMSQKIFARKCKILDISNNEERTFLDNNHFQGYVPSTYAYKLVYGDETVAVMTFVKNRFGGNHDYELLRYASTQNTIVVGGASKLFKHFITNETPKIVISYSLRDWGDGGLYKQLGFKFVHNTPPNFVFFKGSNVLRRYSCQKHKLSKLLGDGYDDTLSATDNMFNSGWRRYWDCGSVKWEYICNL